MKMTSSGAGLGRFVLSPVAVVAMLALLTTAVAFAAAPDKTHPPKDQATASATVEESESPEAEESDGPKASRSPGACNSLHGNAPAVIAKLIADWPTKHDKGDKGVKDIPPGLKKVAERLASCQPVEEDPDASNPPDASPIPAPSPTPIVVDDEDPPIQVSRIGQGTKH